MSLRNRSPRPWTWDELREQRMLAVYRAEQSGRERTAVLIWQGDDRQVEVAGATPPLLAVTVDAEDEAGTDNTIAIAGFESLEAGRAHCVEWVGSTVEADAGALGEAAEVGVYAAIRDPGFAGG
jgi:hypothetical protein